MTARKDKEPTTQPLALEGVVEDAAPKSQALAAQATTPAQLLTIAVQQGADIAQLRELMQLQREWEANEARKAYVAAMAAFKREPMEIFKRKLVDFETARGRTTYMHAELSDVTDVLTPMLAKHGLSHAWDVKQEGNNITVTCRLTHELGHSESVSMTAAPDDTGGKNKIQQVGSSNSYLQRYTFLAITGMATKGMDDDGRGSVGAGDEEPSPDVEATLNDWVQVIQECSTVPDLAERRREMIQKLGGGSIDKVPARVREAAMKRAAELQRQDAH